MKNKTIWVLVFAVVVAGGAFFRLWRLNDRPMHTDEAVHAEKFGALLQEGLYRYDPDEFHGPTLNYFTLFSSYLRGEASYDEISETTLRIVPAVFGIMLIVTPCLFIRQIGRRAAFVCALLLAFSPAFVYYSRYYIQETLLVFFTAVFLAGILNYLRQRKIGWAICAGISVGLMHATKETFVFSIAAVIAAVIFSVIYDRRQLGVKVSHLLIAFALTVITSIALYSSFGTNPGGIVDSIKTYGVWAQRAGGQSVHVHPWYYYLDLLTWFEFFEPLTWNEDGIIALAVMGIFWAFVKKRSRRFVAARFFAVYTLILTAVYCAIPYKTPWSMLSFFYGMVLVAGFCADRLLARSEGRTGKIFMYVLLVVFGLISPVVQSWMLNFRYAADATNPYVYAHTGEDIFEMSDVVKRAVGAVEQEDVAVGVIAGGGDYWPLPWYLRGVERVGYWGEVEETICLSPVILANVAHEQELLNTLYSVPKPGERHLYVPLFERTMNMRPGVPWRGYIRKDLWDKMQSEAGAGVQLDKLGDESLQPRVNDQIENLLKFSHRAMNTDFELFVQDERENYTGKAVRAAFEEIDRLERLLSRFVENSDVSRINRLEAGESAVVNEETMNCLVIAERAWQITDGAFDVTIGKVIEAWKNNDPAKAKLIYENRADMRMMELDEDALMVKVLDGNVSVDLGGIGKGYAVDKVAEVLGEWGVERALIHGGGSSVRAMGAPEGESGWPITITNPLDDEVAVSLMLANEVLSSSGLQGGHIIDPATGQPVTDRVACWVTMRQSAALADALTTAGMIMPIDKIKNISRDYSDISVMILTNMQNGKGASLIKMGQWTGSD